jgi:hypothetical protein
MGVEQRPQYRMRGFSQGLRGRNRGTPAGQRKLSANRVDATECRLKRETRYDQPAKTPPLTTAGASFVLRDRTPTPRSSLGRIAEA